jgi:hypothetical protein
MTSKFPTPQEYAAFPPPNYVNPETKTAQVLGILIPMTVLVIVFISARIWSRTVIVFAVGLDDWLMVVAAVSLGYADMPTSATLIGKCRLYKSRIVSWFVHQQAQISKQAITCVSNT